MSSLKTLTLLALVIGLTSPLWAATAATDQVGVSYNDSGQVVLLDLADGGGVALGWTDTMVGTVAGARAVAGVSGGMAEATGGFLLYTLYGTTSHKITVKAGTMTGYVNNSLSVGIDAVQAGGSVLSTLGTKATALRPVGSEDWSLITGIDGSDTWTGVNTYDGAQLIYRLGKYPGVDLIVVVYTIIAE